MGGSFDGSLTKITNVEISSIKCNDLDKGKVGCSYRAKDHDPQTCSRSYDSRSHYFVSVQSRHIEGMSDRSDSVHYEDRAHYVKRMHIADTSNEPRPG